MKTLTIAIQGSLPPRQDQRRNPRGSQQDEVRGDAWSTEVPKKKWEKITKFSLDFRPFCGGFRIHGGYAAFPHHPELDDHIQEWIIETSFSTHGDLDIPHFTELPYAANFTIIPTYGGAPVTVNAKVSIYNVRPLRLDFFGGDMWIHLQLDGGMIQLGPLAAPT